MVVNEKESYKNMKDNDSFDKNKVEILLSKYSSRLSPYLDGESAKK